jgi:NAD dependent epimerase/dehydratase family/Bacterial regulatory protein, Fis family
MSFWSSKRITVTGGAGFLGSFVVEKLRECGCRDVFVPRSSQYDLVDMEAVKRLYRDACPDVVIHLAARVGGIGANRANPGKFFYDNAMMGYLAQKLAVSQGNIPLTARSCGIGIRTLSRKMREYGLDKKSFKQKEPAAERTSKRQALISTPARQMREL